MLVFMLVFAAGMNGHAQIIDNSTGEGFVEYPKFSRNFIQQNKIKSIGGFTMTKRSGEPMKESNQHLSYSFDEEGHLTRIFQTRYFLGSHDTLVYFFEYDSKHNVTLFRYNENKGFYSRHYEYDSLNRVVREEFRRDIDTTSHDLINPVFSSSVVVNYETRSYQRNGNQVKKITYNNYQSPYIESTYYYNSDQLLESYEDRMKMTSRVTKTFYDYNEKAWIVKLGTTEGRDPSYQEEKQFSYDAYGNLLKIDVYKGGKLKSDIQFLYNEKTGLLGSVMDTQLDSNYITVIRLKEYRYY